MACDTALLCKQLFTLCNVAFQCVDRDQDILNGGFADGASRGGNFCEINGGFLLLRFRLGCDRGVERFQIQAVLFVQGGQEVCFGFVACVDFCDQAFCNAV